MSSVAIRARIETMRYSPGEAPLMSEFNIEVKRGEVVALIGRSGIGKTTLLRILAGLERRFEGTVAIDGKIVTRPTQHVHLLFQDHRLLPWKTVYDNVALGLCRGEVSKPERVREWLSKVGILHRANAWPKELSGGERRRAAIARALIAPRVALLLDEPFRDLDLVTTIEVQEILLKCLVETPAAVILISHSVDDAVLLADTIHLLGAAPLKILDTFNVPFSKPRVRSAQSTITLVARITESIMEHIRAEPPRQQVMQGVADG